MSILRSKLTGVAITGVLLVGGFAAFQASQSPDSAQMDAPEVLLKDEIAGTSPDQSSPAADLSASTTSSNSSSSQIAEASTGKDEASETWTSETLLAALNRYEEEHGHQSADNVSDYDGYTAEQLIELAQQNDPKAVDLLAERLNLAGKFVEARAMNLRAAVLGQSKNLIEVGKYHKDQFKHSRELDSEQAQQQAIYAMAAYKVAMTMGDPYASNFAQVFYETSDVRFTDADLNQIKIEADKLQKYMDSARAELGLDALTSESSDLYNKYYKGDFTVHTESGERSFAQATN